MRFLQCGDAGLLVELDGLDKVLALYAQLVENSPAGVSGVVPGARTVLIHLDPEVTTPATVAQTVRGLPLRPRTDVGVGRVSIPVIYDGPDLAEVGSITGLGTDGVVVAHTDQEWTVAFCGFSPGFGYLTGTDDRLHVPRRVTPRIHVPAGSIGLAGEFSGVYPRESPGGWQLIGRTTMSLWGPGHTPPSVLSPGTRVRFVG